MRKLAILKRASPFAISLMLHFLAFFLIFNSLQGNIPNKDNGGYPGGTPNDKVIEKPLEVEITEPPPQPEDAPEILIPQQKESPVTIECEKDAWYGGIGISQDFLTGIVNEVYQGYPAWNAGLRPGDKILDSNSATGKEIRGEPGTELILTVQKQGEYVTTVLKLVRDRICIFKKVGP